jgi:glycerol-3-phosphate O-acyltransferase
VHRPLSGLYTPRPRRLVVAEMVGRARKRLSSLDDSALVDLLEDVVYHERQRLRRRTEPEQLERVDAAAHAVVRGDRHGQTEAMLALVAAFSDEIHGRFDPRVYKIATRMLPRALTALLSQRKRRGGWSPDPSTRLVVEGDVQWVRELAQEATLILAPTHVSNLDSPMIGLALYLSGLPPFVYGAGLNLFSNPVMGWWMHRLGAYTVDRTKRSSLYKDTLKDYSVRSLTTRHHSLFFPGGTRSRSGLVETRVKKGLLGTGLAAWQEMIAAGRPDSDVYVVPLTLSFQLVLEANTLIQDHLAEAGKQRYIIDDDEFARPRRLVEFANRVLDLDASVVARFGTPLDCLGNPVPRDRIARAAESARRRRYVTDRTGAVEIDPQRDRVYTDRLSDALVKAYPKGAQAMVTHMVADAAWTCLEQKLGTRDVYRILRSPLEQRRLDPGELRQHLTATVERVRAGVVAGRWHADLTPGPDAVELVLHQGLDRFTRYHRSYALIRQRDAFVVEDPQLCLYYRNRLQYTHVEA